MFRLETTQHAAKLVRSLGDRLVSGSTYTTKTSRVSRGGGALSTETAVSQSVTRATRPVKAKRISPDFFTAIFRYSFNGLQTHDAGYLSMINDFTDYVPSTRNGATA